MGVVKILASLANIDQKLRNSVDRNVYNTRRGAKAISFDQ